MTSAEISLIGLSENRGPFLGPMKMQFGRELNYVLHATPLTGMWNEKRALQHGLFAFGGLVLVAFAISIASEPQPYLDQHAQLLKAIIGLITVYCWINGMYLWMKGFSRFKHRLRNPWKLAIYASGTIFSGFFMYYRHATEIKKNDS